MSVSKSSSSVSNSSSHPAGQDSSVRPKVRRTRNDPRKEATRIAIIETAEALFAECGIDGVSLRQIGAATGSANTSVVAYHFGKKDKLLEAIFNHRLPAIDQRRGELLVDCGEDVGQLLRALWLPLYEQVSRQGMHSYAGFMSALMHSDWARLRLALNKDYPLTTELGEKIRAALPEPQQRVFSSRIQMTAVMITGILKMIDQFGDQLDAEMLFEDTLRMATAALLAPLDGE